MNCRKRINLWKYEEEEKRRKLGEVMRIVLL
jgi:hypothetical protein